MLYRVVLIFPDNKSLSRFIIYLELPGETDSRVYSFVGNLTEAQIQVAIGFGAYIRVIRVIEERNKSNFLLQFNLSNTQALL